MTKNNKKAIKQARQELIGAALLWAEAAPGPEQSQSDDALISAVENWHAVTDDGQPDEEEGEGAEKFVGSDEVIGSFVNTVASVVIDEIDDFVSFMKEQLFLKERLLIQKLLKEQLIDSILTKEFTDA